MWIERSFALDPDLFFQADYDEDLILLDTFVQLWKLRNNLKLAIDETGKIVEEYRSYHDSTLNKNLPRAMADFVLDELNTTHPNLTPKPIASRLTERISLLLSQANCSEIHSILLKIVYSNSDVVVISPDPDNSRPGINHEIRSAVSEELGRTGIIFASEFIRPLPVILTEGITDRKYLVAAMKKLNEKGLYSNMLFDFYPNMAIEGISDVKNELNRNKYGRPSERILIGIFDRDDGDLQKHLEEAQLDGTLILLRDKSDHDDLFEYWGNGVFSFIIPVPMHRQKSPIISTEFYFKDEEIKRKDDNGKRLFLSSEFNPNGLHLTEHFVCKERKRIENAVKEGKIIIIDAHVEDSNGKPLALSKRDFGDNILNNKLNFNDFDMTSFCNIFNLINYIIHNSSFYLKLI